MDYSRENPNEGVEDMEFLGVLKKEYVEILGLFQNKSKQGGGGGWGQRIYRGIEEDVEIAGVN